MISTSSSNWLDRLRSSRGFPTGNEPDLDRFISLSSSSGSAESATHVTREKPPKWTPPPGEFASVLSDLFNMGGDVSKASIKRKKACRKQSNPRFFNVETELRRSSSSVDGRQNGGFALSGDNSLDAKQLKTDDGNYYDSCTNKIAKLRVENVNDEDDVVVVVENEEAENGADDLREYSRSEVTVIDTSFEEWKSDKWVFRKNDEWKIKEKKMKRSRILKSKLSGGGNNSNSNNNNNNKRKLLVSDLGNNNNTSNNNNNINDNDNNNNKLEGDNDDDQLLMKKKNKKNEEDELPNKRQSRNDKGRESFQKRQAYLGKVPQKRFPCPRPPEKVRNEASPVILIKSIPLNDNTAAMKTGKTSQKIRPKKMKII